MKWRVHFQGYGGGSAYRLKSSRSSRSGVGSIDHGRRVFHLPEVLASFPNFLKGQDTDIQFSLELFPIYSVELTLLTWLIVASEDFRFLTPIRPVCLTLEVVASLELVEVVFPSEVVDFFVLLVCLFACLVMFDAVSCVTFD